eukprot:snap_masked-scaffold_35-processed-gene-1.26-mRNA-1 protein AED:1.00 eAED:1.00 QI:0/0/0/0/1/1/4/0/403
MPRKSFAQATKTRNLQLQITSTESLIAIKNSIRIAVGSICYLRNLIPNKYFDKKEYCGIDIMSFSRALKKPYQRKVNPTKEDMDDKFHHDNAYALVEMFEKGVFDALAKKYLERLFINVHNEDSQQVLESYTFKFNHKGRKGTKSGVVLKKMRTSKEQRKKEKIATREEVQADTKVLIKRLLMITSALDKLPDRTYISINLTYTEDTPSEYEPPYFKAIARGEIPQFSEPPLAISIGQTDTGYSSFVMKLKLLDKETQEGSGEMKNPVKMDPKRKNIEEMTRNLTINEETPVHAEPELESEVGRNAKLREKIGSQHLTQDSMQEDQENNNPMEKASLGKRKVRCIQSERQQSKKARSSINIDEPVSDGFKYSRRQQKAEENLITENKSKERMNFQYTAASRIY